MIIEVRINGRPTPARKVGSDDPPRQQLLFSEVPLSNEVEEGGVILVRPVNDTVIAVARPVPLETLEDGTVAACGRVEITGHLRPVDILLLLFIASDQLDQLAVLLRRPATVRHMKGMVPVPAQFVRSPRRLEGLAAPDSCPVDVNAGAIGSLLNSYPDSVFFDAAKRRIPDVGYVTVTPLAHLNRVAHRWRALAHGIPEVREAEH